MPALGAKGDKGNKLQSHAWDLTPQQAKELQLRLAEKVVLEWHEDLESSVKWVAGVDVGFESKHLARAAVVVLSIEDLSPVDFAVARRAIEFPYVPGYLSFRECPVILDALAQLQCQPQLLLCDGQGIAHPRRFGVACHLGVLTGIPAIGVAKSRLIGESNVLPQEKSQWVDLRDGGERIGAVLRTRDGVKP